MIGDVERVVIPVRVGRQGGPIPPQDLNYVESLVDRFPPAAERGSDIFAIIPMSRREMRRYVRTLAARERMRLMVD